MKRLDMRAGEQGPLQFHAEKEETMYLLSGMAWIEHDPASSGVLTRKVIWPGAAIHVPPGAVHRVGALEDCVFFELSTPHFDDRVNVEHEYQDGHYIDERGFDTLDTTPRKT